MTANGSPSDLVAVVTGVAVLLIIAVIYAVLTAEPGGNHHAPRTPLRVRVGELAASAARSAYAHLILVLQLLAWDPRDAKPDVPTERGDLPVTEAGQVPDTTLGAPQAARRPELDDTRSDMLAIGSGTEATL
jgi:hypothetical protein